MRGEGRIKVWLAAAVFAAVLRGWTIRATVTLLAGVGAGQFWRVSPAAAVAEARAFWRPIKSQGIPKNRLS